jgi:hypothetical protein
MFRKVWQKIRPAIFWSYRRGSWQYDLIVVIILAFIFLTPRNIFLDQPRPPTVQEIESLNDDSGTLVFWVDPEVVEGSAPDDVDSRLRDLLKQRSGKNLRIVDKKPTTDAEGAVRAYLVYARP